MAVVSIKNKLRRGNLLAGNDPYIPTDFESIATVTVGAGGAAEIEFASIGTDWTHLQIRCITRSETTASYLRIRFNGDTSLNSYTLHQLYGDGSSVGAYAEASGSSSVGEIILQTTSSHSANIYAAAVVDILDYRNANKYKTVRSLNGRDMNGSGNVLLNSTVWLSTSAITSIKLSQSSGDINEYSHFALYGIKGAQPMAITYEPIATTTLGSAQATVSFTSISGSYTDLVLVATVKLTSSNTDRLFLQFNGDTATNYSATYLQGDGSAAASGRFSSVSEMRFYNQSTADFYPNIIHIMNYANSTTYKTAIGRSSAAAISATATVGLWRNTAAITQVDVKSPNTFTSGSTFTLYGIASA